jgi:hypothetical protein
MERVRGMLGLVYLSACDFLSAIFCLAFSCAMAIYGLKATSPLLFSLRKEGNGTTVMDPKAWAVR